MTVDRRQFVPQGASILIEQNGRRSLGSRLGQCKCRSGGYLVGFDLVDPLGGRNLDTTLRKQRIDDGPHGRRATMAVNFDFVFRQ
jgi:hypothetical protein